MDVTRDHGLNRSSKLGSRKIGLRYSMRTDLLLTQRQMGRGKGKRGERHKRLIVAEREVQLIETAKRRFNFYFSIIVFCFAIYIYICYNNAEGLHFSSHSIELWVTIGWLGCVVRLTSAGVYEKREIVASRGVHRTYVCVCACVVDVCEVIDAWTEQRLLSTLRWLDSRIEIETAQDARTEVAHSYVYTFGTFRYTYRHIINIQPRAHVLFRGKVLTLFTSRFRRTIYKKPLAHKAGTCGSTTHVSYIWESWVRNCSR